MAYQPTGAPPRASDPQKTAMIISGVIGALALVGVLLIVLTSGTSSEQKTDTIPGGRQGVQGIQGSQGIHGNGGSKGGRSNGGSSDGGSSNGGAGGGAAASGGAATAGPPTRPPVTKQYLMDHFPRPTGTQAYPKPGDVPSNQAWYVNSVETLQNVKDFYTANPFNYLGLTLTLNDTIRDSDGVIGYAGDVEGAGVRVAHLQIRYHIDNLPASTVLIQADYT